MSQLRATPYTMTINGKGVAGAETMGVVNPASGEVFAQAPVAGAAELDMAVSAAAAAFPKWRATPHKERAAAAINAAKVIAAHADELAEIFTLEQGRPLKFAKEEILGASHWLMSMAKFDIPVDITEDSETRRVEVHHEPLGVVCAIVPWNFPVLLAFWKISEILRDVFPAGVLNIITGGDELGPLMTAHSGFAKISFTGSTATGKRIMASAAQDLKRLTLELGGNDAAIILPDVDVDKVAQELFMGAFYNTAQICIATKRMYIHDDIYDALRDKLHGLAKFLKVGDGMEPDTVFGPVQNKPQYLRVKALMDEARADGLTLLEGRAVPQGSGYFLPLTLVDNPPEDARVVTEEAFGPILPLLRYSDLDEVIERANNSEYGLAGAVWSSDIDKALAVAKRLDTGTVWINQNLQSTPVTPLGGHKQSGFGVENGMAGLMEFTQPKAIYIPKKSAK